MGLDALVGEPPGRLHPVVWMGRLLDGFEPWAPRTDAARFVYGGGVAVCLPIAWGMLGWSIERLAPWYLCGLALKAAFAGRSLLAAARRVERAVAAGELDQARQQLGWLVSRPTADLDAGLVASAAIESLAENLVDAWVAPLLGYALFGLGGAYAYRAANTADAMWGYRGARYEWLGKVTARLDDCLNWLPARLGVLLLLVAGQRRAQAFAIWRRDANLTASPNAGQSMAVAAGQLGVRLEKPEHYVLHAEARAPGPADIAAMRQLTWRAMLVSAALTFALRRAVKSSVSLTCLPRRVVKS